MDAENVINRLIRTASGGGRNRDQTFGFGEVKPYDAVFANVPTVTGWPLGYPSPATSIPAAAQGEKSSGSSLPTGLLVGAGTGVAVIVVVLALILSVRSRTRARAVAAGYAPRPRPAIHCRAIHRRRHPHPSRFWFSVVAVATTECQDLRRARAACPMWTL